MKNLLIIVFMLAGTFTGRLLAQAQEMGNKEKMLAFKGWEGHWKGEGSMQMGPGEPKKTIVDERIESKLDGIILLIEGVGKATDPATKKESIVHHALAVLSFDQVTDKYRFRTYLNDGRSADAWLTVISENKYQWGFDTPRGKTRYNIVIDPSKNTWNEIGEYSSDGTTWMNFFEMNLVKVD